MKELTYKEKRLVWNLLRSVKYCFNEDGTLIEEYYQNVVLFDLEKDEKTFFDSFLEDLIA
jgi:hypothetical protein